MAFTINNNLVFIDSMQFINSSLDTLVKNLSDIDFKYFSREFSGDLLELVKQEGVYPYEYMAVLKSFLKIHYLIDAMLEMTGIELELISDIDMYLFVEKGIRGGISYIAKRYSKANNKYMQFYDDKIPIKFIMYLDENLYPWAMSQIFSMVDLDD